MKIGMTQKNVMPTARQAKMLLKAKLLSAIYMYQFSPLAVQVFENIAKAWCPDTVGKIHKEYDE